MDPREMGGGGGREIGARSARDGRRRARDWRTRIRARWAAAGPGIGAPGSAHQDPRTMGRAPGGAGTESGTRFKDHGPGGESAY